MTVSVSPARQVAGFIARFDPAIARLARAARSHLRRRYFPAAVELVYDSYNSLAIGFGPNERTTDAVVSLAVYPRGMNLYFIYGRTLPDPDGLLLGKGNQGRFLRLESLELLAQPAVVALLREAIRQSDVPMPKSGRGYTVIKVAATKQRPRRVRPRSRLHSSRSGS